MVRMRIVDYRMLMDETLPINDWDHKNDEGGGNDSKYGKE